MHRREFLIALGLAPFSRRPGYVEAGLQPRCDTGACTYVESGLEKHVVGAGLEPGPPSWRAGVATVEITPDRSVWMAGFAARTLPSQGVAQPLYAKALALEDGRGTRAVLVALDLLGVTAPMAARVAAGAASRHRLPREAILLNASHTHSGPVVDDQLAVAYDLSPAQWDAVRVVTREVERRIGRAIDGAIEALAPARLAYATGEARFAANRRVQFTPDGPVDWRVPVLRVESPDGALRAIVFGYACHNTTLQAGFVRFHGDYAGVAQAALEARHRGATALFVAGCGADSNPKPRGTLALVEEHGTALADAVDAALPSAAPVDGPLALAFDVVDLPFAPAPDAAEWTRRLESDDVYVRRHARLMLDTIAREGRLPAAQPCPVQVWRVGADLALVALGGEVVVDYAHWLSKAFPGTRVWAAGYSNDVFGYVPSLRVLREGGYEGGGAMLYYGRPGPFAEPVEAMLHDAIRRLWDTTRRIP